MDPSIDDFIKYTNDFNFKINGNLFEPEFSLSSPFSEHSDSTSLFPISFPKTIKNLLDPEEEPPRKQSMASETTSVTNSKSGQSGKTQNKSIFEPSVISESITSPYESELMSSPGEYESKINTRSKKIQKMKETPKLPPGEKNTKAARAKATETLLKKVDKKFIPEGFDDPELDDKTKKKMIQMIRNRVSAQTSRDKKKAYMNQVEDMKEKFAKDNEKLTKENTRLAERIKKLEEENQALKRSQGSICAKCGHTSEFENAKPNMDANEGSFIGRSNDSSSLRRGNRSGMFGFSMAFAVIACFLLFLNGGSLGDFNPHSGKLKKMKPTIQFVSKLIDSQMNGPTWMNSEKASEQGEKRPDIEILESFERAWKNFEFEPSAVLNKIKPLMEQFDSLHQSVYQASEEKSDVVNLPEPYYALDDTQFKLAFPQNQKLMESESNKKTNTRTSTLFCPTGFEFYGKTEEKGIKMEEEIGSHNSFSSTLPRRKTLDFGKAEYVQLLLPKYAVGQNNFGENGNGTNALPTYQKFDEDGSLIEVWCKIFAVRDLSNLVPAPSF